jgi:hypothetical protein
VGKPHLSPFNITGCYILYELLAWLSLCFHEILNSTFEKFLPTGIFLQFAQFFMLLCKAITKIDYYLRHICPSIFIQREAMDSLMKNELLSKWKKDEMGGAYGTPEWEEK